MDRLIEIIRRLLLAVIWFFGGGFALVIMTLSINEDSLPFFVALLIAFGFLTVSFICHTLLNWILAKRTLLNEPRNFTWCGTYKRHNMNESDKEFDKLLKRRKEFQKLFEASFQNLKYLFTQQFKYETELMKSFYFQDENNPTHHASKTLSNLTANEKN